MVNKMLYLLNLFFIGSIFGFIFEQSVMNLFKQPYNSGILHGPWTPIYGLATFIILKVGQYLDTLNISKFLKYFLFGLINLVLLGLLEFLGGYLIEKIFGIVYWDYSDFPWHLGKYVSLYSSLIWLFLAFFFYYFLYPYLKKIIKKIPLYLTIFVFILFLGDISYTIYEFLLYT